MDVYTKRVRHPAYTVTTRMIIQSDTTFTPSLSVIQTHCSLCPYLARKLHKYRPSRGYTGIDNVYATYVSVLGTRSRHGGCHPKLTDLLKCFEIVLHSKASLTHTPHTDRKERYMVSILSGIASVFAAGTLLKRNFLYRVCSAITRVFVQSQPDSSSTTITMTTTSHRETEKSSTHTQSIILRTICTRIHLSMHVHEVTYSLHTPVYLHAD